MRQLGIDVCSRTSLFQEQGWRPGAVCSLTSPATTLTTPNMSRGFSRRVSNVCTFEWVCDLYWRRSL